MNLNDIRDRCRIENGHWLWAGATSCGVPRIWAPEFTLHAGEPRAQTGRRAVWHVKTGQPIPKGWRVFGTCTEPLCIAPGHMECKPPAEKGAEVAASGVLKGQVKRIVANRAIGRARSEATPAQIAEILSSTETGLALAARLQLTRQTISKIRTGKMLAFASVGGIFSGLIAANEGSTRRSA